MQSKGWNKLAITLLLVSARSSSLRQVMIGSGTVQLRQSRLQVSSASLHVLGSHLQLAIDHYCLHVKQTTGA